MLTQNKNWKLDAVKVITANVFEGMKGVDVWQSIVKRREVRNRGCGTDLAPSRKEKHLKDTTTRKLVYDKRMHYHCHS